MKAHLSINEFGNLVARLESADCLVSDDSRKLAEQLWLAGVTADNLTVTDWKRISKIYFRPKPSAPDSRRMRRNFDSLEIGLSRRWGSRNSMSALNYTAVH